METENNNIIAVKKRDTVKAHEAFACLMEKTERMMNDKAKASPDDFSKLSPSALESCSVDNIREACMDTPFRADEVKLVSGHKFPDIVAEKYYGIEVKSTVSDKWKSIGSSILETTRVDDVEDIYMLFGKLGGVYPEFRCRPYQDVLYEIGITHSPRYQIDMEIDAKDSIFNKMGMPYNDFRKQEKPIAAIQSYYKEKAKKEGVTEMPWWIDDENPDRAYSFNIRLWKNLTAEEKREFTEKCMVLFPETLSPANLRSKYDKATLWLCSCNQVLNPNIRDMYSAGGKITHVDGKKLVTPISQIFNNIVRLSDEIKALLLHPSADFMRMIEEFNPKLAKSSNMYEAWLDICCGYAGEHGDDLRSWVDEKPEFTMSGHGKKCGTSDEEEEGNG